MRAQRFPRLGDDDRAPLYAQVEKALRVAIADRDLEPGEALPPERDLAVEFGVSRITVRKAIGGLVADGLLRRRQGAGTFVADGGDRIEKSLSRISSFSEDMAARGLRPHSEWMSRSAGTVTPEESLMLGLSPGAGVYRLSRIRFADDKPMAIEYSTIVSTALPSLDAIASSLYLALDSVGNRPVRALQRLRAIDLDEHRAEILGVRPGSAALLIERRGFLASGQLIEITNSYYRGDSYDFLAELRG